MEFSLLHHVGIVLLVLWLLTVYGHCHLITYLFSLVYLYLVHEKYVVRLKKRLQYEERKNTYQKRLLSDSETVRWLNHAVEKIWPVCMERIASQKVLLPIVPWFLDKYKPWTAKKAVVQHMYLGRNPPLFTEIRVLQHNTGDDHLVIELGMNFCTADDMSAILAVQLRKRLGFGMWTKLHVTGMNMEGKVLVGVKFLRNWPYIGRLRLCFSEPPYFQMTVKPIFTRGLDVTEVPGIAGWLVKLLLFCDNLLSMAFEQTLVQPNMLVVDVEKFASSQKDDWFSVDEKDPIAHAIVEIVEGSDMKPADLNGLSDPYVKGKLRSHNFTTKIQKRTLFPKWQEEFKIPIITWETPNELCLEVFDKDTIFDDALGRCTVQINDLRDGERHDMWLPLQNVKMGRLHLVITVIPVPAKNVDVKSSGQDTWEVEDVDVTEAEVRQSAPTPLPVKSPKVADNFDPIDIEGQDKTGIWVHRPGSEVSQTWEPRKGKNRRLDSQVQGLPVGAVVSGGEDSSSSPDETAESKKRVHKVRKGIKKIGTIFVRNKKDSTPSLDPSAEAANNRQTGVKLIIDDPAGQNVENEGNSRLAGSDLGSPSKGTMQMMAQSVLKQARSFKYSFSMKGTSNSPYPREKGSRLESSEDELLASPTIERVSFSSNPISPSASRLSVSSGPISPSGNGSKTIDPAEAVQKLEQ